MSSRAEALASEFEQVNQDVVETVEGLDEAQWRRPCSEEGWPVAVVAHHIASSNVPLAGFVQVVANGQPVPPFTMDQIDENNARHAEQFADCTPEETLALLRSGGEQVAGMLRGLSDEQLDRTADLPVFGGAPTSARQIVELLLIGHPQNHLASIKAALG